MGEGKSRKPTHERGMGMGALRAGPDSGRRSNAGRRGVSRLFAPRRALAVLAAIALILPAAAAAVPPRACRQSLHARAFCERAGGSGDRRFVVADASAMSQAEKDLAEMTAESQITGIIPIIWRFGGLVGNSLKQTAASVMQGGSSEARQARRQEEERARARKRAEELQRELQMACVSGRARAIERLARAGADVNLRNARDWQRWAPLHYAVAYGRVAATGKLLELGAEVNMQDWDQWTPLHWAAYLGEVSACNTG